MKKIIFILFALTAVSIGWAQKIAADKIPAAVMMAFKSKFPAAVKVTWEKENQSEFEADFNLNGEKVSAGFTPDGNWLQTETDIPVAALPTGVQTSLKKDFADFKIKEASKIQSVKNGNCYEAEITKGKETFDVLFTSTGRVLAKTTEIGETHEEED